MKRKHLKIEGKKRKTKEKHDNLNLDEKEQLRKYEKKRKKAMRDDEQKENLEKQGNKTMLCAINLNVAEKEPFQKYEKKGNKAMRDKLGDQQKEHLKIKDNKRKNKKCDNLNVDEKTVEELQEQRQIKLKNRGVRKKLRDNLDNNDKKIVEKKMTKKEKRTNVYKLQMKEKVFFNDVQMFNIVDPSILTTPAFRLIEEDFGSAIQEGPTYICDICWQFVFRRNVNNLKEPKYQTDIYNECTTGKSDWGCKSCHNSMSKNKMPIQKQLNNMELCSKFSELDRLCPIELMLVCQIIPFIFIATKNHGYKEFKLFYQGHAIKSI